MRGVLSPLPLRGTGWGWARHALQFAINAFAPLTLTACVADVDVDESQLGEPRLLAVRSDPAEALPNDAVSFTALYAGRDGVLVVAPLEWSFCTARRPLAELGPVARACIEGQSLAPIGAGLAVNGEIPADACRLFGPEPPPAIEGGSLGRPVDPDATGGYFQPIVIDDGARVAFFEQRVACGAFGATQEQAAELNRRYRANGAPAIDALEAISGSELRALGDEVTALSAGRIALSVRWASCPASDTCGDGICGIDDDRSACADCETPRACSGPEGYLRFDLASRSLVVEREWLRVSWYTTAGTLELERTGVAPGDGQSSTDNTITLAPGEEALVVAVLRDSRGGASWRSGRLRAE